MVNQEYSIYIAQDNVDEIIHGFSTLYFEIKPKVCISGHHFSLSTSKASRSRLSSSSISLTPKDLKHILKIALTLKNQLLDDSKEFYLHLEKSVNITFIYSPS